MASTLLRPRVNNILRTSPSHIRIRIPLFHFHQRHLRSDIPVPPPDVAVRKRQRPLAKLGLQPYILVEPITFTCDHCTKPITSKRLSIRNNQWDRRVCTRCTGTLVQSPKWDPKKAQTAEDIDKAAIKQKKRAPKERREERKKQRAKEAASGRRDGVDMGGFLDKHDDEAIPSSTRNPADEQTSGDGNDQKQSSDANPEAEYLKLRYPQSKLLDFFPDSNT